MEHDAVTIALVILATLLAVSVALLVCSLIRVTELEECNRILAELPAKPAEVPVMPQPQDWTLHDQKSLHHYIHSQQGRNLVESMRHKLFADHVNACVSGEEALTHNAAMRGWNHCMSFLLYLATEDSISGGAPVNAPQTEPGQREPATDHDRAII